MKSITTRNVSSNPLSDEYGIAYLLRFLNKIESDPALFRLVLGYDLTSLGLNLSSSTRNLHKTFAGPWADGPCKVQDLDANAPSEYLTNATVRGKLPEIQMNKFSDDVLFYLFYNYPGEAYQTAAALELYQRDWRFHKTKRVWITPSPFLNHPFSSSRALEHNMKNWYTIFDPIQWRKEQRELVLDHKELDSRPISVPVFEVEAVNPTSFNYA